jgi:hypothetical protein
VLKPFDVNVSLVILVFLGGSLFTFLVTTKEEAHTTCDHLCVLTQSRLFHDSHGLGLCPNLPLP